MNGPSGRGSVGWTVSLPLLIAAILLAAIVALLWAEPRVARRVAADRVAAATREIDNDVGAVDERLRSIKGVVVRLSADVEELVGDRTQASLAAIFRRRALPRPGGMLGPAATVFDYRRDAGAWARESAEADDSLAAVYGAALLALDGVRAIADSAVPRIWVIVRDGGEVTLAPLDSGYFFADQSENDYRGSDWLERTRPGVGIVGGAEWLSPFFATEASRWLASAATPLTVRGEWWGSVGVDADIGVLVRGGGRFGHEAAEVGVYSLSGEPVLIPAALAMVPLGLDPSQWERLRSGAALEPFDQGDRISIIRPIPEAGWIVVSAFSRSALEASVRRAFMLGRWVLAGLGMAGLFLGAFLGRRDQERKDRADEQLRSTAARFERLFHLLPDGLALARFGTTALYEVNDGFCRISGYDRAELIGRRDAALGLWDDRRDLRQVLETVRDTGAIVGLSTRLRHKDGTTRECFYSGQTVSIDGADYLLSVVRDVTDERRLEQQFVHAQKMEAVGRLAGGLAHDFNNIMTAITGHASLALGQARDNPAVTADLTDIIRSTKRAADLTRQLLGFARLQVAEPKVVDLALQIRESERFLSRLLGEDVALSVTTHGQSAFVRIDPGQFEQVMANLVINAGDAMPHGGRLQVDVDRVGSQVMVAVTDSGMGMTDEVRAHIFEPFFTTKEVGSGTGLGLPTCYGIVQQSGGTIEVESVPGSGTTVRLAFPAVEGTVAPSVPGAQVAVGGRGTGTVLVVEDEVEVREVVRRSLAEAGYRVFSAATGAEAVERFVSRAKEIDLLVTDVVMPGIGGVELAATFRRAAPDLAVLLVSGYPEGKTAGTEPTERMDFLAKPFRPDDLVRRVTELVGARPRSALARAADIGKARRA